MFICNFCKDIYFYSTQFDRLAWFELVFLPHLLILNAHFTSAHSSWTSSFFPFAKRKRFAIWVAIPRVHRRSWKYAIKLDNLTKSCEIEASEVCRLFATAERFPPLENAQTMRGRWKSALSLLRFWCSHAARKTT